MTDIFEWIASRLRTHGDVGRWHACRNYPGEMDFVEVPLFGEPAWPVASDGGLSNTELAPDSAGGGATITPFRTR